METPVTTTSHDASQPSASATTAHGVPPVFTQPMDRRLIIVILALELGSFLMVTTILLVTGSPAWLLALVLALMATPVLLLWKSRLAVRVADDRLRYTFFPFWRGGVDYQDIERVEVVKVNAMGQFGGWGPKFKLGGKGFGLIARCGSAVRIERTNKRPVYITIDNADELAIAIMEQVIASNPDETVRTLAIVEKSKPWFLWLTIWMLAAVVWGFFIAQIGFGRPVGSNPPPDPLMWILTLLIGVALPLFFWMVRITVRVDQRHMSARLFPFPAKHWPLENIVDGRVVNRINPLLYGGYGLRWLPGVGWLYALRHGDGVELRFADGKQVRIVCEAPEQLLEVLGLAPVDEASGLSPENEGAAI